MMRAGLALLLVVAYASATTTAMAHGDEHASAQVPVRGLALRRRLGTLPVTSYLHGVPVLRAATKTTKSFLVRFVSARAMAVACKAGRHVIGGACTAQYPLLHCSLFVSDEAESVQKLAAHLGPKLVSLVEQDDDFVGLGVSAVATSETQASNSSNATDCPWGVDRINQSQLPLDGQCQRGGRGGAGVRVFVIDSGVNRAHNEFRGRIVDSADFVDGTHEDCQGHGSHVAGTALGSSFGVAPKATLVPVRVLDCNGSSTTSIVLEGINYVAETIKKSPNQPSVAVLSLGGIRSALLNAVIRDLVASNIVVVAAAGNVASDVRYFSPASEAAVLTVSASTRDDSLATFSNFGQGVDLIAPGEAIRSAWMGEANASKIVSGTSMAAPHAAGVAARLLSRAHANGKSLSSKQVMSAMIACAERDVIQNLQEERGTPNLLLRIPCSMMAKVVQGSKSNASAPGPVSPVVPGPVAPAVS